MTCTFGLAPSSLIVLPARTKQLNHMPRANIMDFAPMVNIMPFGMCNTLSNPTVASATAAAMGVLTPMPCIPAITAPWTPGNPQCMIQGAPALTRSSQCVCMWGGMVRFTTDGQMPGPPPMVKKALPSTLMAMPDSVKPLTQQELEEMTEEEQEAYQKEMAEAQKVGLSDKYMSEELDDMAERYRANGDEEKAQQCEKASLEYKMMAANKQADAMNNVNNKYRGTESEPAREDFSRKELEQIKKDSSAKEKELSSQSDQAYLDYLNKKNETNELKKDLKEKNQDVVDRKADHDKAKEKNERLTKEWKTAEANVGYYESEEQRAIDSGDPDRIAYAKMKREEAERYAAGMKMIKEESDRERSDALRNYVDAQNARSNTKEALRESESQTKKLEGQYAALDYKREQEAQKVRAAESAMEAMDAEEKATEAKAKYAEAKEQNNEARRELSDRRQEEQELYREKQALKEKGWDAYADGDGEKGLAYMDQASAMNDDISKKNEEVKQAQDKKDAALNNLNEAYQDSYSDDAKLEEYAKLLEGQMAQQQLKKTVK